MATVYFGCGRSTSVKTEVRTALTGGNAPPMTLVERISLKPAWKFSKLHAKDKPHSKRQRGTKIHPPSSYAGTEKRENTRSMEPKSGWFRLLQNPEMVRNFVDASQFCLLSPQVLSSLLELPRNWFTGCSWRPCRTFPPGNWNLPVQKTKNFPALTPVFSRIRTGP